MAKRSKEAMKKAKEAEAQKMKDQQNGIFEKCHRPTLTGVLNGEAGDCKIKPLHKEDVLLVLLTGKLLHFH